ncbi:AraC family transcriptional regulator [Desulfotignum balticum]|uniref:AraC family transcriptional regulator n=1 Tax=Desulfotignum balticum TaxID=115781 RepID=UPI0012EBD9AA|nr:AraC family transcriptional regulator [Desulfotignum balticum]
MKNHEIFSDGGVSMIDQYRRHHENLEVFVESTPVQWDNSAHLRLELSPRTGTGWMEMWQLHNGLTIGLCDYQLNQPLEACYTDKTATLGFRMSISGEFHFSIPEIAVEDTVKDGDLWLCSGSIGPILYTHPAGRVMKGFSIELPPWMAEACLKDKSRMTNSTKGSPMLGRRPAFKRLSQGSPSFMNTFTRLLAIRKDTLRGRLQFESLVLDLLSRIFSLDFFAQNPASTPNSQMWSAIDEAVDILKQECVDPPTIPALAKRVAINECYLKAGFRRRAGTTIGEYVRKLRMEKALGLMESGGCSILEAALSVGYANPSHFSAAFKKHYGCLPSRLLK